MDKAIECLRENSKLFVGDPDAIDALVCTCLFVLSMTVGFLPFVQEMVVRYGRGAGTHFDGAHVPSAPPCLQGLGSIPTAAASMGSFLARGRRRSATR